MNKPHSPALQAALAYYDAWRSRDHSTAMNVVADTVVAETPFGRLDGAQRFTNPKRSSRTCSRERR
jgi:hypothetical protein